MYSTRLHVYTRVSLTDILARKSARVGQVGGQVGEDVRVGVGIGPMEFKLNDRAGGDGNAIGSMRRPSVRLSV